MQVTYSDIRRLLEYEGTKEIVPVGSKGIRYEVENLAGIYSLSFDPQNGKIDLECSGGPSTSAVAVVDEATYDRIRTWSKVRYIGKII